MSNLKYILESDSDDEWIEWKRSRCIGVVQIICYVVQALNFGFVHRAIAQKPALHEDREKV